MPLDIEPIDAVRFRIVIDALKDVGRTHNIAAFPIGLAIRRKLQNIQQPGEVAVAKLLSKREEAAIPVLSALIPFLKELEPAEFSALVSDIKAGGRSIGVLEEATKAVDPQQAAQSLKPLRYLNSGYSGASMVGGLLKGGLFKRAITAPFRSIRRNVRSIRYDLGSDKTRNLMERGLKGGPGSGNWGHEGRVGGGSTSTTPRGGGATSSIQASVPGFHGGSK